jgi:hypothetical protein
MNDADISPLAAEFPQPPDHLREALGLAAREELEFATDGVWPDDSEEYAAREARVAQAVDAIKNLKAGACSHDEVAKLAAVAVGMQEPDRWPRTTEEADDVLYRAILTRDLIQLRDVLGGRPSDEELDEPM